MVKISHTNIIVDQFSTARNNPFNKYVHFLTHIHTDHLKGLSNSWDYGPIYCSEVTQSLILLKYPRLKCLKVLQMEKQYTIQLSSQLQITVTMFDANHCAGGVMFLFQGYMGTVLYTGDIRFDKDVFSHYNYLYPHTRRNKQFKKCSIDIDFLYLDTTFLHPKFSFPPKPQALKSLDSYIEDTIPKAKEQNKFIQFYIGIDSFGKQEVLVHLAQKFETLVTVSEERYKNISVIGLESEYFTTDADAGFIHVVLKRDMRQCMLGKQNSMGIILTGWANSAHNRSLNTYAIPYSLHSSYPELVQFVDSIRPCYIESILEVSLKRQSGQQRQQSNSRSNNTNRSSSLQKAGELKLAQKYTNPHSNSNNNKNTQQYQLYQQINTSQYLNKLRQQYTSKPSQQLVFLMTNTQFQQKIKQKLKLDRQSTQLNRQLQLSSSISNITRVQNVYRAGAKLNNERDQKEIQRLKQRVKSKRQSAAKNVLQKISISKNKNQPSKSTSLPNRQKQRQKKREPQQQGQRQQQQQQNKNSINIGRSRQEPYQIQDGQDSKQSRLNHKPILLTLLNQIQISGQSSNRSNRQNINKSNQKINKSNQKINKSNQNINKSNQNIDRGSRNNRKQHQKQEQQNKDNQLIISDSKQQQQSSVQQLYQQQQHINRQQNNLKDDRQEQSRMKKWKKKMQQGQIDLFSNINNNTHIATKNNIKSNSNNDNITRRNDAKWNYYNNNKSNSINNKNSSNKNSVNSNNNISNSSKSSNNNNNSNNNSNKKYIQKNNIIQLLSDQSQQQQQNHLIDINVNTNAVSKSKRVIKITNKNNNNNNINNNNNKNINNNNNNKSIYKPPTNSNNNINNNNKPINNNNKNALSNNNNIPNNQDHTPLPKQRQPDQRSIIQYFNKNKKSLTINQYPFKQSQQKQSLSQSKQKQKNNKYIQHENQHKQHDNKSSLLQIEDHHNQYQNNHNNNNNEQNDYNSPNNNNNNDIDNNNSSQQQKYQLIKSIQQQKRQQQQSGIKILRNSKQISILNINMNNINLHKQIPSNHYQHFFQTKTNSLIN